MKEEHPVIEYVKKVEAETLKYVDRVLDDLNIYFVCNEPGNYHGHLICTEDHFSEFELAHPELNVYTEDEISDGDKIIIAREFDLDADEPPLEKGLVDSHTGVLFKNAALMKLLGLHNSSKELLRAGLLNDVSRDNLLSTIFYSHKKFKSFDGAKNASQKTHRLKKEIISVIKSTWEMYPSLSKGRMIEIIKEHYSGGVSEKTLKTWIKDNKLAPAQPKKYYSGAVNLVFPDKK